MNFTERSQSSWELAIFSFSGIFDKVFNSRFDHVVFARSRIVQYARTRAISLALAAGSNAFRGPWTREEAGVDRKHSDLLAFRSQMLERIKAEVRRRYEGAGPRKKVAYFEELICWS